MKTNSLKICLLFFILLFCVKLNAQRYDSLLKKLSNESPLEKLYLQLDRSVYNAGETIWFKATLFSGNFPSLISKTIYTELTDINGKTLNRIISPVVLSGTAGSIEIPADAGGTVLVRAYTKWMLNFDPDFLFTKTISIIPVQKAGIKTATASTIKTDLIAEAVSPTILKFFPEGGDLVLGVESRIAFKATNGKGMPVNISGEVSDSKGKIITSFTSVHDGMGMFKLLPQSNEQYKAVWKEQSGLIHETILPTAKQNGIVLQADVEEDQIEFTIKRSSILLDYPFVYVVAQMNHQQVYRAKANITKTQTASGIIPVATIPAGIIQITVFSPEEQPLAERIVFANLSDHSFATVLNITVKDTGRRKKNVLQIEVPDSLSCNLSVAVTDADLDPVHQADNIFSHLLLTADIKGYVHEPAYYFSNDTGAVAEHLDLVMMTNGWRRFKWEDLLAGRFPKVNYLPENYISVEGQVHDVNKRSLIGQEINGILETKNKGKQFLNIPVQPDGKFNFSGMVFFDTAKLFYQFNKDKKKTLTSLATFNIKSNLLPTPLQLPASDPLWFAPGEPDTALITNVKVIYQQHLSESELYKYKKLTAVTVITKLKTKQELMDEEYTSGYFSNIPSGFGRNILPEDDPAFLASQNLLSFLQNRVAGLQVNMSVTEDAITWRSFPTALFVNEVPQTSISFDVPGKIIEDAGYMLSLSMSEIAMVKIYEPPFFGAGSASYGGQGGAISVYLKKGRLANEMIKGLEYTLIPGYSPVREFYSPDYSMPDQNTIPDYRSTLYWNPFVITGKNNRSIILSFYNNDITKKMKLIIEGWNENGKLTRVEKIVQ